MARANPFRFSAKYQDDETDLLYYGYRYYNASMGRWASRDPLGDLSFLRAQARSEGKHVGELVCQRLKPSYVFVSNDPSDGVDPLGLNVYKVTSTSAFGIPLHRQIIGDDGKGGCYILEFFGKKCRCSIGYAGYYLIGKGNVAVGRDKRSARDYIISQGDLIVNTVRTDLVEFYPSGESVDLHLSRDVDNYFVNGFGMYVFLWNDCGTIANAWLRHTREVLEQAESSYPAWP